MRNSYDERNIYTPMQIGITSVFGGVLAGCWMIANNYKAFSQPKAATQMLVFAGVSSILLILISMFLPDSLPVMGIVAGIAVSMYQAAITLQGEKIKTALDGTQTEKMSIWSCVLVAIVSAAVLLVLFFITAMVLAMSGVIVIAA